MHVQIMIKYWTNAAINVGRGLYEASACVALFVDIRYKHICQI